MTLKIIRYVLGPMENNSYLIGDTESNESIVIDPSFQSEQILKGAEKENWKIKAVWLTHAHFDHFAGVSTIALAFPASLSIGLHKNDLRLWENGGGAAQFGIDIDLDVSPTHFYEHNEVLRIGNFELQVRHTPGHSEGHVIFYSVDLNAAFCGDVIFSRSIGRTDLMGGDYNNLIDSIKKQILTLPPFTMLYCGHGEATNVENEIKFNPFLQA